MIAKDGKQLQSMAMDGIRWERMARMTRVGRDGNWLQKIAMVVYWAAKNKTKND